MAVIRPSAPTITPTHAMVFADEAAESALDFAAAMASDCRAVSCCSRSDTWSRVGTLFGNSTVVGSSTSENVSGPDVTLTSTVCPLRDPVRWNVYLPRAVGKKYASYSAGLPRPLSGSNDGCSGRFMLLPCASTATFREFTLVTAFPLASCTKIWTKFFSPRYAGSRPKPISRSYGPTFFSTWADAGAAERTTNSAGRAIDNAIAIAILLDT